MQTFIVDEAFVREFWRVRNKVDKMSGDGVDNSASSIVVRQTGGRRAPLNDLPQPSLGQYRFMSFQMVAQNTTGWDFERLHPMIGT